MTPNFLGPYWGQINYTGYTPHTMTLPIKGWNPGPLQGDCDIWSGGTISALSMFTDFATVLLPLFNADTSFNNFIIFKQLLPADDPQPVASANFSGLIGTNTSATWAFAVERIFLARSTAFGLCKLDLLDAVSNNSFTPIISPGTDDQALLTEWMSPSKGWSARDNFKPDTFLKITCNLNQKLRKELRLD